MKRFKKYNDLVPAREEFDKFCLSHSCDKCPLYPFHSANQSYKGLGCFGSWLNEEISEDGTVQNG